VELLEQDANELASNSEPMKIFIFDKSLSPYSDGGVMFNAAASRILFARLTSSRVVHSLDPQQD